MTAGHGRPKGEGGARVNASPSSCGLGSAGLVRRHRGSDSASLRAGAPSRVRARQAESGASASPLDAGSPPHMRGWGGFEPRQPRVLRQWFRLTPARARTASPSPCRLGSAGLATPTPALHWRASADAAVSAVDLRSRPCMRGWGGFEPRQPAFSASHIDPRHRGLERVSVALRARIRRSRSAPHLVAPRRAHSRVRAPL